MRGMFTLFYFKGFCKTNYKDLEPDKLVFVSFSKQYFAFLGMGENTHNERPNNLTHCVVLCCILIFLLKCWFLKGSYLRQRLTYHFNLYFRAQSSQGKSETEKYKK